jgi:uncharacterized protein
MTLTSRGILTYLLLVVTLSLGPYLLVIHAQHLAVGFGLVVGVLMWMPATAACLTCRILGIDIASLGWNWRPVRFEVLAYIVPVLYALPVYIACWTLVPHSYAFPEFASGIGTAFGFPGSSYTATFLLGLPVFATFGIVRSIAAALAKRSAGAAFCFPASPANSVGAWAASSAGASGRPGTILCCCSPITIPARPSLSRSPVSP